MYKSDQQLVHGTDAGCMGQMQAACKQFVILRHYCFNMLICWPMLFPRVRMYSGDWLIVS